jgi:LDH2 family malate/lactate/ureidoglycolate dehydrogenase
MDVVNGGNSNGKQPQKSHEEYLREFAGELNEILQKGYPLAAVIQVLDSALFEMKMTLYFKQMEAMEQEKRRQIQIPKMTIPTGKVK